MSCIFSCFRVKDASSSVVKKSTPKEYNVNRNRSPLSSFLIPEVNVCVASKGNGLVQQDLDFEELKNQAKFLKAYGTTPKTPTEIRKSAGQNNDISSKKGDVESRKLKSWLTDTSLEKLDLESQLGQLQNLNKDSEEWLDGNGSQEHTPSSCITFEHKTERISPNLREGNTCLNNVSVEFLSVLDHNTAKSSVSSSTTHPSIPSKNKSAGFDHQTLNVSRKADNLSNTKPYPYPTTALKLTDGMQAPGTVFMANGTQYVSQSAANLVKGLSGLDCGDSFRNQVDHHGDNPFKKTDESGEPEIQETSIGSETSMLSSPLSRMESPNLCRFKNAGDRPIIGLVATHWNENEPSRVSPKWWDGNGIPNSTNKYREDQKVSFYATSFEERLEKALSEETLISKR